MCPALPTRGLSHDHTSGHVGGVMSLNPTAPRNASLSAAAEVSLRCTASAVAPEPSEQGEEEGVDIGELLRDFAATTSQEELLDCSTDEGLDIGQQLEDIPLSESAEEPTVDLDVGVLLADLPTGDDALAGDLPMPLPYLLDELVGAPNDALEQQDDGPLEFLDAGRLKPLPGLSEDETDNILGMAEPGGNLALPTEQASPPWSAHRLVGGPLSDELPPCQRLAVRDGRVVAAGAFALVVDGGESLSQFALDEDGGAAGIALLDGDKPHFLVATTRGRLHRLEGRAGEPSTVSSIAADTSTQINRLETLCSPQANTPHTLLARFDSGQLLRTTDGGSRWKHCELHGRLVALTTSAQPAAGLLLAHSRPCLLLSTDLGADWRCLDLPSTASRVVARQHPLIAASGELVAVASAEDGLWVSVDGGHSFSLIPGCTELTAVEACQAAPLPLVWCALLSESRLSCEIVRWTQGSSLPERVAELKAPISLEPEQALDWLRVEELRWDRQQAQLWAAGGFGVARWRAGGTHD
jgi:hypothetical protein